MLRLATTSAAAPLMSRRFFSSLALVKTLRKQTGAPILECKKALAHEDVDGDLDKAVDYLRTLGVAAAAKRSGNDAMEGLDAAVTISSMETPSNMSDMQEVERTYARQARAPFNLIGNPAIAIPTGFHSDGLPLALQIVSRAFDEAMCFRVAWAVEQELNVAVNRPPV